MLLEVTLDDPRLAMREGLALREGIPALLHMLAVDYLLVAQYAVASILRVLALEFQLGQLLDQLPLHRDKLRFFTHHGAGARLTAELV